MPRRLFISHSSPTPAEQDWVRQFAQALERDARGGARFEVLLDRKDLRSSDVWARKLHDWLAWCQAGVVLLTPAAIRSDWVLKEATILAWRMSQDPDFRLFPARFSGVDDAALRSNQFGPLFLDQIQNIRATDPAAVAEEVASVIGSDEAESTPLDRLANTLAALLEGHAGRRELRAIGTRLGVPAAEWRPGESTVERWCLLMARQFMRQDLGGYAGLDEFVNDLVSLSDEYARRILELVAPYWVPAEDAGRLVDALRRPERWTVAINGRQVAPFTSRMYVGRAFPTDRFNRVVPLSGGGSERMVEEAIEEIDAAIRKQSGYVGAPKEEFQAFLRTTRHRYYVPLARAMHDEAALARLEEAFPRSVVFVLHPGKVWEPGDALRASVGQNLCVFDIDLDREGREFVHYRDAAIALGSAGTGMGGS